MIRFKNGAFLLAVVLISTTTASSAHTHLAQSEESLPAISLAQLKVGQEYQWDYFENGQPYSTEKYRVLNSSPDNILIEMSTRLKNETEFRVHHRLEASLTKCLAAYKSKTQYKPWRLKMYYWHQEQWNLVDGLTSTAAFEEKFNCNPHRRPFHGKRPVFATKSTVLGESSVFQFRYGRTKDRTSWYFLNGYLPGILAFKKMSEVMAPIQYEIHLKK